MRGRCEVTREADEALALFGADPLSVTPLSGGLESTVWCVDAGDDVFSLRRYDPAVTSPCRVGAEVAWLAVLGGVSPLGSTTRRQASKLLA